MRLFRYLIAIYAVLGIITACAPTTGPTAAAAEPVKSAQTAAATPTEKEKTLEAAGGIYRSYDPKPRSDKANTGKSETATVSVTSFSSDQVNGFVKIMVSITNSTDKPVDVSPNDFALASVTATGVRPSFYEGDDALFKKTVQPGETATGAVVFETNQIASYVLLYQPKGPIAASINLGQ